MKTRESPPRVFLKHSQKVPVTSELSQFFRKCTGIPCRNHKTGFSVRGNFRKRFQIGNDHGTAVRHRLDRRKSIRIGVRRQDEDVSLFHERFDIDTRRGKMQLSAFQSGNLLL